MTIVIAMVFTGVAKPMNLFIFGSGSGSENNSWPLSLNAMDVSVQAEYIDMPGVLRGKYLCYFTGLDISKIHSVWYRAEP